MCVTGSIMEAQTVCSPRIIPPSHRVTWCRPKLLSPTNDALFSGVSLVSMLNLRTFSPAICWAMEKSDEGRADGSHEKKMPIIPDSYHLMKSMTNFALTNFLPIALLSGVALGFADPTRGCLAHKHSLTQFATLGIFFISGLKLQDREIGSAAQAWPLGLYGLASILLISPFLSKLILQFQLSPQEFITGLAIFTCMPTTLSSGVALTQLAGGNSTLALVLTVMSNLLGTVAVILIFYVPFWVSKFFADGFGVSIPTEKLFWSLMYTLLAPSVLGKAVRYSFRGLATHTDQNKRVLTMTSTILLSLTPWMQVSKSRDLLLMVKPLIFLKAIGLGIVVHLLFLGFNAVALKIFSTASGSRMSSLVNKKNARALMIVCSQKALLIVVAVVEQLNGALGEPGLLVLPCVAAHITQIIIDSLVVNFWLQRDRAYMKIKTA
ncbi:probable sodium/metabolite cotransporter BASS4, chloroplastic [Syzygium oleosum]|uniref:probable sodium/metabolite cotransporter BASS4, chloroplastic n=1 Tax=Syzygium oleosum TaxID=219896 RepID=UPI0024BB2D41|nr:probable sodium/metabolite cotransporter BASS4, chloroplastic [Syzygium oleosum]